MLRGWLAAALAAALVALSAPAAANHPQAARGDAVAFDHKAGNEWWVEAVLSGGASGSVQSVQAMDTGGAWVALTKRSWGAWAASFHVEPGHQVKFRAAWPGGEAVESCWFDHPSGVERCPQPFDATFTGVRGNEWWVQASVATNGPAVARVDVSLDGGAWQPLAKQPWGPNAWAASYRIAQGTIVQLRATAGDGRTDLSSCRQWVPPSGQDAAIAPCRPAAFDATFSAVKGNEWWAEAVVAANEPVQLVLLMVDCDTTHDPHDMVHRPDWGKWVLGTHIPAGSVVTMTAYGSTGTDTSATYLWPQGTVVEDCPPPWPQPGSFADVRFRDELREFDGEGGERYLLADGLVHAEWTGSAWDGTCQQRVTRMDWTGAWSNVTETHAWDMPPPVAPTPARAGDLAEVQTIVGGCRLAVVPGQTVVGEERRAFALRDSSGNPVPIDAYHAEEGDTGFFQDYWWDTRLGLMLEWDEHSSSQFHVGNSEGWLLATDAGFR